MSTSDKKIGLVFRFTQIKNSYDNIVEGKGRAMLVDDFIETLINRGFPVGSKNGSGIIPCVFKKGAIRNNEGVDVMTGLVLDFDGKTVVDGEETYVVLDRNKILKQLPFKGIAHSSYSDTPEYPRFRVILPFKDPLPVDKYVILWEWVNTLVDGILDRTCIPHSHLYYLPRCAAPASHFTFNKLEGPLLSYGCIPSDFEVPITISTATAMPKKKQGAFGAIVEIPLLTEEEANSLVDCFLTLDLCTYLLDDPNGVSRDTWLGVATNLVCCASGYALVLERCRHLFHDLSKPYDAYSFNDCEKAWQSAIKFNKPRGWAAMTDVPEELIVPGTINPLMAARRKFRAKQCPVI